MKRSVQKGLVSHLKFLLVLTVFGLFLSACGVVESDITVYNNNRFEQEVILSFSRDEIATTGGIDEVEMELEDLVSRMSLEGLDAKWQKIEDRQDNTYKYKLRLSKTDLSKAESLGITWQAVDYNQRKVFRFEYPEFLALSTSTISSTLTLHAGKILESNGNMIDEQTVRWVNPGDVPYAIVEPKSSVSWLPLILAFLILAFVFAMILVLFFLGPLKKWVGASFLAGKWRVQTLKLGNDRSRLEKNRNKLVSELGEKAWESRVVHPSYAILFGQLETLEEQKKSIDGQIRNFEETLRQLNSKRSETDTDFINRISELVEERKIKKANFDQNQSTIISSDKRLNKLGQEKIRTEGEIKNLKVRLDQASVSTADDKETQITSLSKAINALEQSLTQLQSEEPRIEAEISRLKTEQRPVTEELENLQRNISQLQAEQRDALAPLDQEIKELKAHLQTFRTKQSSIGQQVKSLISQLGPEVDRERPDSVNLSALYGQIDQYDQVLNQITQQYNLLKARLNVTDKGAVIKLVTVLGVSFAALIVAVVLLWLAYA